MSMLNPYISYETFLEMQSNTNDKLEYQNGVIVNMSPTSIKHNDIVNNIMYELKKFFKGSKCKVHSEQIGVLFEDNNSRYEFQPDVFVICDGKTKGEKFISTPCIIFEVLSKATASNDLFSKPLIYEKFGVMEYNIVSQDGSILQYGLTEGSYSVNANYTKDKTYESIVFDELKFSLDNIFE